MRELAPLALQLVWLWKLQPNATVVAVLHSSSASLRHFADMYAKCGTAVSNFLYVCLCVF